MRRCRWRRPVSSGSCLRCCPSPHRARVLARPGRRGACCYRIVLSIGRGAGGLRDETTGIRPSGPPRRAPRSTPTGPRPRYSGKVLPVWRAPPCRAPAELRRQRWRRCPKPRRRTNSPRQRLPRPSRQGRARRAEVRSGPPRRNSAASAVVTGAIRRSVEALFTALAGPPASSWLLFSTRARAAAICVEVRRRLGAKWKEPAVRAPESAIVLHDLVQQIDGDKLGEAKRLAPVVDRVETHMRDNAATEAGDGRVERRRCAWPYSTSTRPRLFHCRRSGTWTLSQIDASSVVRRCRTSPLGRLVVGPDEAYLTPPAFSRSGQVAAGERRPAM